MWLGRAFWAGRGQLERLFGFDLKDFSVKQEERTKAQQVELFRAFLARKKSFFWSRSFFIPSNSTINAWKSHFKCETEIIFKIKIISIENSSRETSLKCEENPYVNLFRLQFNDSINPTKNSPISWYIPWR